MSRIIFCAAICLAISGTIVSGQCPEKYGRYPVPGQCDAYIECTEGQGEEKLCPDGLLFNDKVSPLAYPCQYPIDVSCDQRARTQPPQATEDCPRQFGYYRIGDSKNCGKFMNCASGRSFIFDCPEGLAWNKDTYRCDWPDQVPDCDVESFLGFTCPNLPKSELLGPEETRFFRSPSNCQHYFACIDGRPRLLNCGENQAFNEQTNTCDEIENVPGCVGVPKALKSEKLVQEPIRPRTQSTFQQQPRTQSAFQQQARTQSPFQTQPRTQSGFQQSAFQQQTRTQNPFQQQFRGSTNFRSS